MSRLQQYFTTEEPKVSLEEVDLTSTLQAELGDKPEEIDRIMQLIDSEEYYNDLTFNRSHNTSFELLFPDVSQESFSERMTKLWDTFKGFLKRIATFLTGEATELRVINKAIRLKANSVRAKARSQGSSVRRDGKLVVDKHVGSVSMLYRLPRDIATINAGLIQLKRVVNHYFDYIDSSVIAAAEQVNLAINRIDPSTVTPEQIQQNIVSVVLRALPTKLLSEIGVGSQLTDDIAYGPQLIGNVRLKFTLSTDTPDTLKYINDHRISLEYAELQPKQQPSEFEIPRFQLSQLENTLKNVFELSDVLETTLSKADKRAKAVNNMIRSFDVFVDKVSRTQGDNPAMKHQIHQLMSLSRTLGSWLNIPYRGLAGNVIRAMRGAIYVCEMNTK